MGKYRPRGELGLPTYKGNEAEYHRLYWAKRRAEAIEILGGKCVECGEPDTIVLQIDHVDGTGSRVKTPGGKRYNWTTIQDVQAGRTENYQLLCANCHARKTYANGDYRA